MFPVNFYSVGMTWISADQEKNHIFTAQGKKHIYADCPGLPVYIQNLYCQFFYSVVWVWIHWVILSSQVYVKNYGTSILFVFKFKWATPCKILNYPKLEMGILVT